MRSGLVGAVLAVLFLAGACSESGSPGGGGLPLSAPGTKCDPALSQQGCHNPAGQPAAIVECDAVTGQWKLVKECAAGEQCLRTGTGAATKTECAKPGQQGGSGDAGTIDASAPNDASTPTSPQPALMTLMQGQNRKEWETREWWFEPTGAEVQEVRVRLRNVGPGPLVIGSVAWKTANLSMSFGYTSKTDPVFPLTVPSYEQVEMAVRYKPTPKNPDLTPATLTVEHNDATQGKLTVLAFKVKTG